MKLKLSAHYIASMGILTALCAVLSLLDSIVSSSVNLIGVRIGLANIAIIICMLKFNVPSAAVLSLMRSGFVFLTRGMTAGVMSLSGGIASFIAAALLIKLAGNSMKFICIISAMLHTIGQIIAACFIISSFKTVYYVLILLPVSIVTGYFTGTIVSIVIKHMKSISYRKE